MILIAAWLHVSFFTKEKQKILGGTEEISSFRILSLLCLRSIKAVEHTFDVRVVLGNFIIANTRIIGRGAQIIIVII